MCREHAPEAVAALVRALANSKERVPAAIALLDRGFGRPKQQIETNDPASPILLHLLAAQTVSRELLAAMEQREHRTTINGSVDEPGNGHAEGNGKATADLLNAPLPTE
jgi:hypothetical protein